MLCGDLYGTWLVWSPIVLLIAVICHKVSLLGLSLVAIYCKYLQVISLFNTCLIFKMEYSPEEIDQLVKTLKELGVKPKADSKEDLVQWMSGYVAQAGVDEAQGGNEVKPQVQQASVVQNTVVKENIPRIPIFNGAAQTKAEHVPFEVWQYEVNCLMGSKRYSEAVILQAMRQSLRGDASKVAVRLGENVTVAQLLERMRNLYGSVSVGQDVLAAFYSAEQDQDENVVAWSCRLEDLMQQAIVENKLDVADRNDALRAKL